MRKFLSVLLVLLLVPMFAIAEVDLSGMSYDELVALKDQINLAIWQSEEWQEVEVPAGLYVIGEDIPAGKWTIKAADEVTAHVKWGNALDPSGADIDLAFGNDGIWEAESLYSPSYKYYKKGDSLNHCCPLLRLRRNDLYVT